MIAADPVRLIEAAYTHEPDEGDWLGAILAQSDGYDLGPGVLACTVNLGAKPGVRQFRASKDAEATAQTLSAFVERLAPRMARAAFVPTEFPGNAVFRLNRLLSAPQYEGPLDLQRSASLLRLWAVIAGDGEKNAVMLAFPASGSFTPELPFPHRGGRSLGFVGAHLGAALRLRGAVADADESKVETADAVLSPRGEVLSASGPCRSASVRRSLSEAVVRAERARGAVRRSDGDEAATLWQALVAGQWSIVEIVERDGKRLLVARANPHGAPNLGGLTSGERDVVWLAAFGHSLKYIAYELGLSVPTVARRLGTAMPKLGVASRRDLVRKLAR